ncbi:MAG: hypothetical protein KC613_08400 [Myxococcales bacterium]|nr:hypothetical protein [Myxococcales bacterium]MCB9523227.1 hypothetical protein [Myxococcales bacterium]
MPYELYKIIHLVGLAATVAGLGGVAAHTLAGGTKGTGWRKGAVITHGVGLFLVLLGGFGMLARLQIAWPWPKWVIAKIIVWIAFGGLIALGKKAGPAKALWFVQLALVGVAAWLAITKPF